MQRPRIERIETEWEIFFQQKVQCVYNGFSKMTNFENVTKKISAKVIGVKSSLYVYEIGRHQYR